MLAPNRPDVLDEVFDGEAVLVNLRTGRYYSLDARATVIWQAVVAGEPLPEGSEGFAQPARRGGARGDRRGAPRPHGEHGGPVMEVFTDMEDILLLDPIHDVDYDAAGWPARPASPAA